MARINTSPRSRKIRKCGSCGATINVGDPYRYWSLRFGGKYTRCMKSECSPLPHEMTSAKYGVVQTAIHEAGNTISGASSLEEIQAALEEVAQQAHDCASEYQESIDISPNLAGANGWEETMDQIESFADELENGASSLEPEDEEAEEDDQIDSLRTQAAELLDAFPL